MMKKRRSGVTMKIPKKEQIMVKVKIRPISSCGVVPRSFNWYMAGREATKRADIPPAPTAAAWTMEFSCGPK